MIDKENGKPHDANKSNWKRSHLFLLFLKRDSNRKLTTMKTSRKNIYALIALCTAIYSVLPSAHAASVKPAELKDWPRITSAIAQDPIMEAKIARIVSHMTLAQKIGQMTQPEIKFVTPEEVKQYYIGSVLNGGGSWPNLNKQSRAADWVALSQRYYQASMSTDMATPIPVIWGIDAIHGNSNVVGATLFPHNIGLGAAHNPKLVGQIGKAVAKAVRATGINWVFAPTIAVSKDERWGRAYESFSQDGKLVNAYAGAYVKGLQGDLKNPGSVVATAKHFIGDGGTAMGVDRGVTQASLAQMINSHGQGYYSAFAAGAQTVMASYNSWYDPVTHVMHGKMHGNRELLTTALKEKMGFDGFVVSDWDGIAEVEGCSNDSCARAINAGIDMVMVPDNWKSFIANTVAQVERGEIAMSRIDDAVSRILRVKLRSDLFEHAPMDNLYAGQQTALQARSLARQAVRESLVLLKNNQQILPLKREQKILVVGKAADSHILQSGGWSLTWQGTENQESDYTVADTLLAGFREVVGEKNISYSADAKNIDLQAFDVVIAVLAETPYAEGFGDIAPNMTLSHSQRYPEDLAVLKAVAGKGKPVVTILMSGRAPYANDLINLSDSFVAAWLPGSEGKGVADVLFRNAQGKTNAQFSGSLSFAWPRYACLSAPLALQKNPRKETLFGLAYGLNYGKIEKDMAVLEEDLRSACEAGQSLAIFNAVDTMRFPLRLSSPSRSVMLGNADHPLALDAQIMGGHISAQQTTNANHSLTTRVKWMGMETSLVAGQGQLARIEASAPFVTQIPKQVATSAVVQWQMQVHKAPLGKVLLSMDCGDKCAATLDVTHLLQQAKYQNTQLIKIPLACFVAKGFDPRKIKTAFSIGTSAAFEASFADIQLRGNAESESDVLACADL